MSHDNDRTMAQLFAATVNRLEESDDQLDREQLFSARAADMVLRHMSDHEVKRTIVKVYDLMEELKQADQDQAMRLYFHLAVREPLEAEFIRRRDLADHARAQLDADGHEVHLGCEDRRQDLHGDGWSAWCTCDDGWTPAGGSRHPSEDAARRAGQAHIDAHGGAWAPEHRSWWEQLRDWPERP